MIGTEPSTSGAILRKLVATTATDNFTMSIWFRCLPGSASNVLAYNGNELSSGFGFQMNGADILSASYGSVVVGASMPVAPNQWHHAVLFRRAGTSQMIVDGHRFSATWANAPNAPNGGVDEIRMFETNGAWANGIGATSEVGVWTVPLSLDLCAALARGAKPNQVGPRPVFYWTGEGVRDLITGVAMTGNSYRMVRGPDLRTITLPFAVEVPISEPDKTDEATVYVNISVTGDEDVSTTDSATIPVDIRNLTTDTAIFVDVQTVYYNIQIESHDCQTTWDPAQLFAKTFDRFETDANHRWRNTRSYDRFIAIAGDGLEEC